MINLNQILMNLYLEEESVTRCITISLAKNCISCQTDQW